MDASELNSASRTRSEVGRVPDPGGAASRRPPSVPATIRVIAPTLRDESHALCDRHKYEEDAIRDGTYVDGLEFVSRFLGLTVAVAFSSGIANVRPRSGRRSSGRCSEELPFFQEYA